MIVRSNEGMALATSQVLETFLREYCEVNGIKEDELNGKVDIMRIEGTGVVVVKENGNTLFRNSLENSKEETGSIDLRFFLSDKTRFPKTAEFIRIKSEGATKE